MRNKPLLTSLSVIALAGSLGAPVTMAQSSDMDLLEEVVTVGSRTKPRSATDSPVPVDVINADELAKSGSSDMLELLKGTIPSFNVLSQPISDAASIIRPVNLRGLPSDSTLVLVNGKRRHRSSVIVFQGGGLNKGAQGPDISVIPSVALKQIEVLRDGAAAQYGSDAIAGVMNFVLKDDAEGGSLEVKYGQYGEGDGDTTTIAANIGMPLTSNGFVNASLQWNQADDTVRSGPSSRDLNLIADGVENVPSPSMIWGSPKIEDDISFFVNAGLELGNDSEAYLFANHATRSADGGFYFRPPNGRQGVFTWDGNRLIANVDGNCNLTTGPAGTGNPATDPLLASIIASDSCWAVNELYSGGYTPRFVGKVTDSALTAGTRGTFDGGFMNDWSYDFSAGIGRSESNFGLNNTLNPSMGPDSPTNFDTGSYIQQEKTINIDFSHQFGDTSVAFGTEWREDSFQIVAGETASWKAGRYADLDNVISGDPDPTNTLAVFTVGSHGFPGFHPDSAGSFERNNYALYTDLEHQLTDGLLVGGALRYEEFSDFGDTLNYKLTFNWSLTDDFAFRGSLGTGFRAPTVGQTNVVNSQTTNIEGFGLMNVATLAPSHPVSVALGAKELTPEESESITLGMVAGFGDVDVTIDFYQIEVTDRITVTDSKLLDDATRATLPSDMPAADLVGTLTHFNFFTNDFDTTTKGVDIVATYGTDLLGGSADFSMAYNYNETEVDSYTITSAWDVQRLEEELPNHRGNLTWAQYWGDFSGFLRANYYGEYLAIHADDSSDAITGDAAITLDLEVAYNFNENLTVKAGANNLLDQEPMRYTGANGNPSPSWSGAYYYETSPFGINGSFYYMKASYSF
ncbi:TonB-dependent receptor [Simiduia litorea]|uniref:TonB-dependent receptor plug domain-containing protein n=1 Tax=Simiduia litorea TaxID=1435348 RepID=UPI0036F2E73C